MGEQPETCLCTEVASLKKMHVKPFQISSRVVIIGLKVFLTHKNKEGEGIEMECRQEPVLPGGRDRCNASEQTIEN